MLRYFDLVYVEWDDHTADGGWSDPDVDEGNALCGSSGWLLRDLPDRVVLIGCMIEGSKKGTIAQVGNKQTIMRQLIKRIEVVRKARKPKSATNQTKNSVSAAQ